MLALLSVCPQDTLHVFTTTGAFHVTIIVNVIIIFNVTIIIFNVTIILDVAITAAVISVTTLCYCLFRPVIYVCVVTRVNTDVEPREGGDVLRGTTDGGEGGPSKGGGSSRHVRPYAGSRRGTDFSRALRVILVVDSEFVGYLKTGRSMAHGPSARIREAKHRHGLLELSFGTPGSGMVRLERGRVDRRRLSKLTV